MSFAHIIVYSFWADPVTFLIEKGTRKVILIGGRALFTGTVLIREERFENEGKKLDLSDMPEDEHLRKEVLENGKQLENDFLIKKDFSQGTTGLPQS
jgi:hypothetical protein